MLDDDAVQVRERKRLARASTPVPQYAALDVRGGKGLSKQHIFAKVEHGGAQVIACPPIGVQAIQLVMR
ncbi:hypothetical protein D3C72_2422230 [compost metagenome]